MREDCILELSQRSISTPGRVLSAPRSVVQNSEFHSKLPEMDFWAAPATSEGVIQSSEELLEMNLDSLRLVLHHCRSEINIYFLMTRFVESF